MDPVDKAKGAMGGLERLIAGLPGIAGYKNKEMRRDADKQVRDTFVNHLDEQRRRLVALQNDLLSAGGLAWMADLERLVSRTQLLMDRVRTASYGYAPFFALQKVREPELERLAQFDRDLLNSLPKLSQTIDGLQAAVRANKGVKEAAQVVADLLVEMNDSFGQRAEAMLAAE